MLIAKSASAALQDHLPKVVPGHVRNDLTAFRFPHYRAVGHFYHKAFSVLAVAALFAALFPVLCDVLPLMAEIGKGIESLVHLEDQVAALAAVAAVGAAVGHIEFSPEGDMAVAALAASDIDFCSICKHIFTSI